jgi:type III restriction enzyme
MEYDGWHTPFYQALAGLTGSGKTPMLADSVSQIRSHMAAEPIVLWIAKSKAVVEQTFANLEPGGKYENLIEGFMVNYLSELDSDRINDDTQALIALTTVGTFNDKERSDGTRKVHKTAEDSDREPLWKMLTERVGSTSGARRPLMIVYDEAQNLTDQQTELLFELEPNVLLVASATMKTPARLGLIIDNLKRAGWTDEPTEDTGSETKKGLITAVRSSDVVDAGLIKRQVILGGYATEMETALNDMFAEFTKTTAKAEDLEAGFRPKAIYVCRTNINHEDGSQDLPTRPFNQRKAPPILIWRHLVETLKIDPAEIAVYCDLKVDRRHNPPPEGFNLFSGGEDDFSVFTAGNYRHIIFNLSLQEGWDDPACCFAYIDKSMGSPIQVEQVIGRVLRQPGARHYPDPDLNTANFYIRIDNRQEFPRILETVRRKIAADVPEVKLEGYSDNRDRRRARLEPKEPLTIPEIHIDADEALVPLQRVIATINDYTKDDGSNIVGPGELSVAVQEIGRDAQAVVETRQKEHSNRVIARWLIRRAMMSLYPEATKTVDWADSRFEARIEVTSRAAAHLREKAESLVDEFLAHAELAFEDANLYAVSSVIIKPDELERFENAVHEGYSDLKGSEPEFARAIDNTGYKWVRNPSNGGYSIPLLEKGGTRRFFPDFIVWKGDLIYAIDPKGEHLIKNDAGRKLLAIRDENGAQRVVVRLITVGRWNSNTITQLDKIGFSVWRINSAGQIRCTHHETADDTTRKALDL